MQLRLCIAGNAQSYLVRIFARHIPRPQSQLSPGWNWHLGIVQRVVGLVRGFLVAHAIR